jgi:hypothetical protein
MKFGIRTPSLRKRIAARTSWKRVVRHSLGFKAPRGFGWFTNPRRAAYNRIYNRTTVKADPFIALRTNKKILDRQAEGSLIVTKLALASLSRQDIPEHERRLHTLYVDEVQAFVHGINFSTILAESRKYALALVVATQTMAGLPEGAREAIFGNCGTLISFRVSGEDANSLVREFGVSGEGVRTAEQSFDVIVPASRAAEFAGLQNLHPHVTEWPASRPIPCENGSSYFPRWTEARSSRSSSPRSDCWRKPQSLCAASGLGGREHQPVSDNLTKVIFPLV